MMLIDVGAGERSCKLMLFARTVIFYIDIKKTGILKPCFSNEVLNDI